jgi:hypothetical protein
MLRPGDGRHLHKRYLYRAHYPILQADRDFGDRRAAIFSPARQQGDGEFRAIQRAALNEPKAPE